MYIVCAVQCASLDPTQNSDTGGGSKQCILVCTVQDTVIQTLLNLEAKANENI